MKKIPLLVILLLLIPKLYGQTLTYQQYKSLVPYLKSEDWKSAFNESNELLKVSENDTSDFHAIIVYINIYSAAGMIVENEMTYEELENNLHKHRGQRILMPVRPITTKPGSLNCVDIDIIDANCEAFTAATNSDGANILCFEKYILKDKINPDDYPSESKVRCGGILKNVEINPNNSLIWILRLTIEDAFIRKDTILN